LDVKVSVNRMPQAARYGRNGTGNAQAAITQIAGLDERNPHQWKAAHDLDRYDGVARLLHWIFAAGIIYASIAGYTLARLSSGPERDFLSRLNMSIATVLMVLFPLRVFWKFVRVEPRELPGVSSVQRALAHRVHILIYLTIFTVLASGFLMVPNGYSFFGLVEIHTPFGKGALTHKLFAIHQASCALLAGLAVLHVLAVVKHQLITGIDVLRRML
jgi:cytochrome b561